LIYEGESSESRKGCPYREEMTPKGKLFPKEVDHLKITNKGKRMEKLRTARLRGVIGTETIS